MLVAVSRRVTICHYPAGWAIDNGYHQREGRIKSLQPWLSGTARQPLFTSPQVRKLFFGKVCTDLIDKTYQRKPRQTRAIAGIVKKNSLHQQTKKPLFFQFYGLKRGSLKNTFHSAARGGEFSRVLSGTINTTGRQTRRFSLFMKIFREKSDPFFFSVTHCLIVKSSKKERI